jgi:hypothetical protein
MSKNAMAGAVTLCGVGLCMIGGALMMQSGSTAHAGSMPAAAAAVAAATHSQAAPTIVWYQAVIPHSFGPEWGGGDGCGALLRAWSDGTVEGMIFNVRYVPTADCETYPQQQAVRGLDDPCNGWRVISSPTQGYKAASDSNADEKVDAIDLASILTNWGDAPRVPFPPSDCPLNLINP